jgi:cytochrome-b5 reductase
MVVDATKMTLPQSSSSSSDSDSGSSRTETVIRPYTPISTNAAKGYFDLLVKNYGPTSKMSRYLTNELQVGDTVHFSHSAKNVKIQAPFDPYQNIVMLVGGTGIAPMIQALHAILGKQQEKERHPQQQQQQQSPPQQKVTMIYASRTQHDILGQQLIDTWATKEYYADQFKIVHVLSQEPNDSTWMGARGHMDRTLLEKYLPDPSSSTSLIILVCGPPSLYQSLCGPRDDPQLSGVLADMGYTANQVYKF